MTAAQRPRFDDDLIDRHGGPGPRYTSYPTADRFHDGFPDATWTRAIAASNELPIPADLSLYVHVPFCASPCFYCGCNRVITRSPVAGAEFLGDLERELALLAPRFDRDRRVRQVHLGGGTPTFLSISELEQCMTLQRDHFPFDGDAEIGLEVDPRTLTPADMPALAAMGFNRLSVGVQDLDPEVQRAINRVHDSDTVAGVVEAARGAGFDSISLDLIYGLPLQTTEAFAGTVEAVLEMRPDRLSLFNYAHLPHRFKAQRQIRDEDLPAPAVKLAMFRNTLNRLLDAGYEFIGMDHFALPDDALARARRDGSMVRNFQGYSTRGGLDLLGLGPSAISRVGDAFAQNHRKLPDWQIALREGRLPVHRGLVRSDTDRLRAEIIGRIMCRGGLDYDEFDGHGATGFRTRFALELARLTPLADDGLIDFTPDGFRVTETGMLFLRAIARVFDANLAPSAAERRFSRIV